jgi:hypothetical protein
MLDRSPPDQLRITAERKARTMNSSRTAIGLFVSAGLLVGGAVAAGSLAATGALAASNSPTPTPTATASPRASGDGDHHGPQGDGNGPRGGGHWMGPRGGLGQGRMLHGEMVVEKAGGGTVTILVQHGSVTAKTAAGVTVKSTDGFTVTWKVTSATEIWAGRPAAGTSGRLADIATGTEVTVTGPKTPAGGTASMLGVRPAGRPGGGPPGIGTATATASPAVLNG